MEFSYETNSQLISTFMVKRYSLAILLRVSWAALKLNRPLPALPSFGALIRDYQPKSGIMHKVHSVLEDMPAFLWWREGGDSRPNFVRIDAAIGPNLTAATGTNHLRAATRLISNVNALAHTCLPACRPIRVMLKLNCVFLGPRVCNIH